MDYVGATTWKIYSSEFPEVTTPTQLNTENLHRLISLVLTKNDSRGVFNVIKTQISSDAGSFTPRINRGEPGLFYRQYLEPEMSEEVRAYENIINSLEDIFQTIEPENGNLNTYGNKIRELIIIACTEVEYLLKMILTSSGVKPKRRNYTTEDYIWCLSALKLNWYCVSFNNYLGFNQLKPFKGWSNTAPTASLPWYDTYNKVKHDRGNTKSKATLEVLINSIAAIHILLEAQYGKEIFEFRFQHTYRTLFRTDFRPRWEIENMSTPILSFHGPSWVEGKPLTCQ
ncbi:hypothetical protein [Lelliottia sp. AC1]|uniref:hypothetical protein n=1 Tax=Lelliottia sp. AC1 TaxID=2067959 RepID=UPI00200BB1D4|nr:hypothetical protein [Lelliottia sp. AC1]